MSEEVALDAVGRRYQLAREVGRGGMSVVYEAMDPRIDRRVAIKLLHPHLATRADARRRFLQEATAIARLENPYILKVYDYDSPDGAASYIVSEFIDGVTFRQWAEDHSIKHWEIVALLCIPLFRALEHAHEHRIIHRDVKPENMMIRCRDGTPVLMDFGIAHMVDSETLTATGAVIGSPAHMAPEIVNGEALTPSADLFSMGTVLYWMTCGALPFVAPNPAALFKRILEARFDPVRERRPAVTPSFAQVIEQCMRRDPLERPKSASHVADRLEELLIYAGIDDISTALKELAKDPHTFQSVLSERMVPHYCEHASKALNQGQEGLAIELGERALVLAPDSQDAKKLVERAKRILRKRRSTNISILVFFLFAITLIPLLWSDIELLSASIRLPNGEMRTSSQEEALRQEDRVLTVTETESQAGLERVGKEAKEEPSRDKTVRVTKVDKQKEKSKEDRRASVKSKRRLIGKQKPFSRKRSLMAKSKPRSSKKRPKHAKTKSTLGEQRSSAQTKGEATPSQRVKVSSRYKGVNVFLDGQPVGHIYEIDNAGGLDISLGTKHVVQFRSPFCEDRQQVLFYRDTLPTTPQVVFECVFKPATLYIRSSLDAEIFIKGIETRRLGRTNQLITLPLSVAEKKLTLQMMTEQGERFILKISVMAGRRREVRWR